MNIDEIVQRAMQEKSLVSALTIGAIWETERIIKEYDRNRKNGTKASNGVMWDSMFGVTFQAIIDQWEKCK